MNKETGRQQGAGQIYSTPAAPGQVLSTCHRLGLYLFIVLIDEQFAVANKYV